MSESGLLDLFFFMGDKPTDIVEQFTSLVGKTSLPPLFSLGYHQCRWNYMNIQEVLDINDNLEKFGIPSDVIWLDIEHTDGKRYFSNLC